MSGKLNDSNNVRRSVKSPDSVNSRARKRLGAILNADPLALIVTNRRARLGLKPTHIGRYQN